MQWKIFLRKIGHRRFIFVAFGDAANGPLDQWASQWKSVTAEAEQYGVAMNRLLIHELLVNDKWDLLRALLSGRFVLFLFVLLF